jgi:hypothetical protein
VANVVVILPAGRAVILSAILKMDLARADAAAGAAAAAAAGAVAAKMVRRPALPRRRRDSKTRTTTWKSMVHRLRRSSSVSRSSN